MAKRENEATLESLAEVAGALSEPHRLRALGMLVAGELCLCDLTEGLELSASTVSNHMAVLKRAGLVESRKDGRWMHFRLASSRASPVAATGLRWILDHMPETAKSRPEDAGECQP
jgi:ArsR family transcriptional regulator, arsenate/arsenite/antimonite-responsive transcriptional repressor